MRRILTLLLLLLSITISVKAVDLSDLERAVPRQAEAYLDGSAADQRDFLDGIAEIVSGTLQQSTAVLRGSAAVILKVLLIVVLCRLVEHAEGDTVSRTASMTGALAITACCVSDLRGLIGLGKTTMNQISSFSTLLMPVMASAAAASGSVTGAGVMYTIVTLFSNFLIRLSDNLLIPVIYGYLALGLVDCALQETRLAKLRELLAWCIKNGLKLMMYLFTGFLAVTGILSGNADAAALKAAKVTISGMVPVVGGIISDAAETVLASGGVLKSAVGTFGMLAILAVFAMPFFRMGINYLAFKLTTALSGVLGSKLGVLLDAVTDAMGFLLAMTGSSVLMCLIACCCFMKAVSL